MNEHGTRKNGGAALVSSCRRLRRMRTEPMISEKQILHRQIEQVYL